MNMEVQVEDVEQVQRDRQVLWVICKWFVQWSKIMKQVSKLIRQTENCDSEIKQTSQKDKLSRKIKQNCLENSLLSHESQPYLETKFYKSWKSSLYWKQV